ncbi:MAG: carboxypeptidase regulatory-like domain-containing protein [Thermogutta sp.]|nr:carboxypeptidase regulatory-like domain-containing protein [Thermogutta sp.]
MKKESVMKKHWREPAAWLAGIALVGIVLGGACNRGASKPKTYPVTGTVTMNGQPVVGATVTFTPKEPPAPGQAGPQAAGGVTDEQGRYQIGTFAKGDGALPGEYLVSVTKYEGVAPTGGGGSEEEYRPPLPGEETPVPKNVLPPQYANPSTSGLSFKVEAKDNTFDITL